MTAPRLVVLLKSKTVWGAVLTSGAWFIQQPHHGVIEIVRALGMVLGAAGVRDAIQQCIEAKS